MRRVLRSNTESEQRESNGDDADRGERERMKKQTGEDKVRLTQLCLSAPKKLTRRSMNINHGLEIGKNTWPRLRLQVRRGVLAVAHAQVPVCGGFHA